MPDTSDTSATRGVQDATRVLHERHKCDMSATQTNECDTSEKFWF